MKKVSRYVGLDVHAETIAVAVADVDGEVRSLGTIPNRPELVWRLVKWRSADKLAAGVEALEAKGVKAAGYTKIGQ